jgi:hypothetical protein
MPKISSFVIIMPKNLNFLQVMLNILTFAKIMPIIFTFVPIMPKKFTFAIVMPNFKFCEKYLYKFNLNNMMNMLSKIVRKKKTTLQKFADK